MKRTEDKDTDKRNIWNLNSGEDENDWGNIESGSDEPEKAKLKSFAAKSRNGSSLAHAKLRNGLKCIPERSRGQAQFINLDTLRQ